jgi:hypothetical protein
MTITHVSPDTMHFSQAVLTEGGRTLYIGERNGPDAAAAIVPGGAKAQALAAPDRPKRILADVGAEAVA